MKKLASIIGIGVISMSVALAPAFAQQSKPADQPNTATVQPKTDSKSVLNPTGKDEKKTTPAVPGKDAAQQTAPAKPAPDVKATTPAKPGADMKTEALPGKPGTDNKAGAVATKPESGVKDEKAATVKPAPKDEKASPAKPGAALKEDKTVKSQAKAEKPAQDVTKSDHKHAKTQGADASKPAGGKTVEKTPAASPSTAK